MSSAISISVSLDVQKLRVSGSLRVGDAAVVTVKNYGDMTDAGLVLRLAFNNRTVAQFPANETEVWTASGAHARAVLNLDTEELAALARRWPQVQSFPCRLTLESANGTVQADTWLRVANVESAPAGSATPSGEPSGPSTAYAIDPETGLYHMLTVVTDSDGNTSLNVSATGVVQ